MFSHGSLLMFEGITQNLKNALSFIERSRLSEGNIREGLEQVRQALLEADVNFEVAGDFIQRVTEQAVGEQVLKSIRPSEQIVGIVHQELVELMGPVDASLPLKQDGLTVLMLCGLQGSGKNHDLRKTGTAAQGTGPSADARGC